MLWRIKVIFRGIFSALSTILIELCLLFKMFRLAERFYMFVLKLFPDEKAMVSSGLGSLYERSGNLDKALTFYEEACNLEPQEGFYYMELGNVYEKQDKVKLAIESYEKGLQVGTGLGKEFKQKFQSRIEALKNRAVQ